MGKNMLVPSSGKKKAVRWLIISLVICFLSMVFQSLLATSFGSVVLKDSTLETSTGHTLSGTLYIPRTATAENPAPTVLVTHGTYKSREVMSGYSMELSRRGYVVFAFDLYGMGESGNIPETGEEAYEDITGIDMYEALKYVASLPYVDETQIAATGHSSGGGAINVAFEMAQEAGGVQFAACIPVDHEPEYYDADGNWANIYGSVPYGVVASKYDDWYFSEKAEDGTWLNAPRDYIHTDMARSFLSFGKDPADVPDEFQYNQLYTQEVNGETAYRIVYQSDEIHSWSVVSQESCGYVLDFLNLVMPAPNPIDSSNQHGLLKEFISFAGMAGVFMFLVSVIGVLVNTSIFASLKAEKEVVPEPAPVSLKGKLWFWGAILASAAFALATFFPIFEPFYWWDTLSPLLPQSQTLCFGFWGAAGGLFSVILMVVCYKTYKKKEGMDLRECGIIMSARKWAATIALSLTAVFFAMCIVFGAKYFFNVNFEFWVISLRVFRSEKVLWMVFALPLFLLYYIPNSIAANCFRNNLVGGKEWVNLLILGIGNALSCIIMEAVQYGTFISTGVPFWSTDYLGQQLGCWLYGIIIILAVAPWISRKIYKATCNPYLAGIVNGLMVTIMSVSFTAQYI